MKELTFAEAAALKAECEARTPNENAVYEIIAAAYKKGYEAAQEAQKAKSRRG